MAGFGETLRQTRAQKDVTLREAEQATRINRHHLAALEEENFDALPPLIYQRGIVRNYASYLDIDPSKMLAMFEEAHGITATGASRGVTPPPIDMPSHWAPNFAIIAFAVVLSAIVFAWGYSIYVTPPGEDPAAILVASTTTPLASNIDIATQLPEAPVQPTVLPTEPPAPTATTEEVAQVSGRQNDQPVAEAPASDNTYVTGITVVAKNDIQLTAVVDDQVVYDGVLPTGQMTDQFVGSSFQFTTSSGASTGFVNACGDPFEMGTEESGVTYDIQATENSCRP
jgi:cytoskeletal protein RodZ